MLVKLSDLLVLAFYEFVHPHLLSLPCLLLLSLLLYLFDIQLFGLAQYPADILVMLSCDIFLPWILCSVLQKLLESWREGCRDISYHFLAISQSEQVHVIVPKPSIYLQPFFLVVAANFRQLKGFIRIGRSFLIKIRQSY